MTTSWRTGTQCFFPDCNPCHSQSPHLLLFTYLWEKSWYPEDTFSWKEGSSSHYIIFGLHVWGVQPKPKYKGFLFRATFTITIQAYFFWCVRPQKKGAPRWSEYLVGAVKNARFWFVETMRTWKGAVWFGGTKNADGLKFHTLSKQIDVEDGTCGAKTALSDKYLSVSHIAKRRPPI